ncbi:MAG: TolC family protein [Tannerellaceae bacterium]|nr:TolC family protein [Tannerellaceae bacterium]
MKRLNYIAVGCSLLLSFPVSGQEMLTLEKSRALAVENNKQMGVAGMVQEQSGYELKSYKAKFLPHFSATGTYLFSNSEMKRTVGDIYLPTFVPDPATGGLVPNVMTQVNGNTLFNQYAYIPGFSFDLKTNGSYMGGIQVEQPLYTGGKIRTAYRMAQVGQEMAGINRTLTHTEVIRQTDEAYWTAIQVRELLTVAEKYKEMVTELMRNMENAFRAGMVSRNDVLKVQVKLNEAELQILRAKNGIRLADMNLCHRLGLPLDSSLNLQDSSGSMYLPVRPASNITARPEYLLLEKQVQLSGEQVKQVQSDYLPQVGVMANYGYTKALKLNDLPLFDSASFNAIVSVSIPLFQWGEGRNKVRAAKTEKKIRELQLEDNLEKMELQLMQAIQQYEESLLEVQLTTSSLAQAEENMHVSGSYYGSGLETLADYLEAQTVWQKAWADQVEARTKLRLSETNYLISAGRIFE